ncbi:MAG: hypothetical protein ACR2OE_07110, partial [Thermomicrobiales bacterium]
HKGRIYGILPHQKDNFPGWCLLNLPASSRKVRAEPRREISFDFAQDDRQGRKRHMPQPDKLALADYYVAFFSRAP